MKILIVSDTHSKNENLKTVIEKESPLDMVLHLGDAEGWENLFRTWLPPETGLVVLKGNNDFFSSLDTERALKIGNLNCLLCHGHYYNVSLDTDLLRQEAKARSFDIAMFGHTHRPLIEKHGDLTLLNPGSLSYPRQAGRKPSYIIMETNGSDTPHFALHFLERPEQPANL